jgi:3-methyladenine DNA glycosylase AlkC
MAEPLKNQYGPEVARRVASMIGKVYPAFKEQKFLDFVLPEYDSLELMPRGWLMADGLHHALPNDYEKAIDILLASLPPAKSAIAETSATADREGGSLAPFLFMPHTFFVARYGLEHFSTSMRAQYQLTQRFTAEFSIRPFLDRHTDATLETLQSWIDDPSEHVRRLISEGTRPRLPWASRLRKFQKDPAPVLALLEQLKDDPSLYVRRSVANNLNDIGKDNPQVLFSTTRRWMANASTERAWVVRHALRVAIKNAEPQALAILGFGQSAEVFVENILISPTQVSEGGHVSLSFTLSNKSTRRQALLIDFQVHYVKANAKIRPKVFKLTQVDLAPDESIKLGKRISLAPMTTRRHYPGEHQIDLLVNGQVIPLGSFMLDAGTS